MAKGEVHGSLSDTEAALHYVEWLFGALDVLTSDAECRVVARALIRLAATPREPRPVSRGVQP